MIFMKKFVFFCLLLLININIVHAEELSAYLENLTIENGQLSPSFDKFNNTYSISIDENDTKLDILYSLEDKTAEIEILNNDLITDDTTVYINVSNGVEEQSYKIIVNKEKRDTIANIDNQQLDLSVEQKSNRNIILVGLIICWLLVVGICKMVLFPCKKRKNK